MRYEGKRVIRYKVVAMMLGLAIPVLVGVASAQEGGHVRVLPYGNGQSAMCEVDGSYRDCYQPAPVTLYPPSQVGTTAGDGGHVRVTPYGNGQSGVCEVDGWYRDCFEPAPVILYPPSQVGAPAGVGDQSVPSHEGGGREGE